MQTRRPGLSPLAVSAHAHHAPLPRRSSLLSLSSAASPHTPRSSGCFEAPPPPVCYAPTNRISGDSWASSTHDDIDIDWKHDHILLLSRTLDALPAYLLTPFHGPVPPSNLLDKIARGVAHAKGPADWPHSTRATRAKLLELARARAKEDAQLEQRRHALEDAAPRNDAVEIVDGDADLDHLDMHPDKPLPAVPRRPLYRQSSMDFIKPGAAALKDNPNIARLSTRLQRTEAYHPYARPARAHAKSALCEGSVRCAEDGGNDVSSGSSNSNSNSTSTTNSTTNSNTNTNTSITTNTDNSIFTTKIPKLKAKLPRRSESPPHQSDVPSLIAPSTSTSTSTGVNSSLSSLASASSAGGKLNLNSSLTGFGMGLKMRALRRTASSASSRSSSLFSSSSAGSRLSGLSGSRESATDPRLQRVRRSESFGVLAPPSTPRKEYVRKDTTMTKDYALTPATPTSGFKRAPSYGALAVEAKSRARERGHERERETEREREKEKENEAMDLWSAPCTPQKGYHRERREDCGRELKEKDPKEKEFKEKESEGKDHDGQPKHTRQLSAGSYPSSDEEEKARTRRAKKLRTRAGGGGNDVGGRTGGCEDVMMSPGGDGPPSSVPPSPATPARARRGVVEREQEKETTTRMRARSGVVLRTKDVGRLQETRDDGREKESARTKRHTKSASCAAEIQPPNRDSHRDKDIPPLPASASATACLPSPTFVSLSGTPASIHGAQGTHGAAAVRPPRMNIQRNPSMFGAELPALKAHAPAHPRLRSPEAVLAQRAPALLPALATASHAHAHSNNTNTNTHAPAPVAHAYAAVHVHTRNRTRSGTGAGSAAAHHRTPSSATDDIAPGSPMTTTAPTVPSSPASPAVTRHALLSPSGISRVLLGHAGGNTSSASGNAGQCHAAGAECPSSPGSPRVKTLRRVRRLAGARRISFGSSVPEESSGAGGLGVGLGLGSGLGLSGLGRESQRDRERERERERVSLGSAFQMM